MPGFATATRTNKSSLINQHLKTNPFLNRFGRGTHRQGIEDCRIDWDRHYIGRNDNELVSFKELFTPYKDGGEWGDLTITAATHKKLKNNQIIHKGYWALTTNFDPVHNEWDFTFAVKVGDLSQFHPKAIRQRIVKQHGILVYEKWKQLVMADFDSLMWLKSQWNLPVPLVTSIACSPSSERLCKRMGFDVRSGVVFWIRE